MKKKAHIISHTHWDREWYINSPFVNEWLPVFFDSLFAMMEKEPEYKFVLDGQTSMLDDCYEELKKQGRSIEEFKEKVSTYARQGRLVLGPYYLQPDWQLVSEEALVRNMSYGAQMARELGGGTSTGWLLDNFGQIAQAPQIHKLFGMKGLVVWRGVAFEPDAMRSEFLWKSPDGTSLTTSYLLSSYRNAMRLADYEEIVSSRIQNETEKIAPFSLTGNVLLMNGYDQEMQPDNILPYIKEGKADFGDFTVCQSTPDEFMEAVLSANAGLPEQEGALYSGRYISVFPGILSARMYLKQRNEFCQRQLEQYVEPLCTMCSMLGMPYPKERLDEVWKLLLKNHPHDSICGVSVDAVHRDMEDRFLQVQKSLQELLQETLEQLCACVDTTDFSEADSIFTLYNPVLRERKETVFLPVEGQAEVKDRKGIVLQSQAAAGGILVTVQVPAFGFCTLGVYRKSGREALTMPGQSLPVVENDRIRVCFREDGTLDLLDKKTGRWYYHQGMLEDCADSGDEYNYSYLTDDKAVTTAGISAKVECVEENGLRTVVRISREWVLPEAMTPSREKRCETRRKLPVVTYVTIERNSALVKFHTVLRNVCKDHRIRVLFPTGLKAAESYAQTQFTITRHPIVPEAFDNDAIPEEVKRIVIGARESGPITQFPQREFAAVCEDGQGLAVLNKGLPEYEVLPGDTTVALTLFRSVGWLARADLHTRIGDAGPEIFVPEAQCLRDMEFEYAICPFEGTPENCGLVTTAQSYCAPVLVAGSQLHTGTQKDVSFLSLKGDENIRITAVKQAQYTDELQIRLYHAGTAPAKAVLWFCETPLKAVLVNLLEEPVRQADIEENTVSFTIKPKEIVTVQVVLPQKEKRTLTDKTFFHKIVWESRAKEDFESYPFPETVEDADVKREQERANLLESRYHAKQEERSRLSGVVSQAEAAQLLVEEKSLLRAYLEARLSALFTEEKWAEHTRSGQEGNAWKEEQTEILRDIAYRLNLARIDKRVSEYLLDYYVQREKEAERTGIP